MKQKYVETLKSKVADKRLDKKAKEAYIENAKRRFINKLKDSLNSIKEKKKKQQQLRDEQAVITANKVVDGAIKRLRQSGLPKQFSSPSTPNELKSKTPEQPPLINPYRRNQLSKTPVYIPTPPKQKKTEISENQGLKSKTAQTLFTPVVKPQEGSKMDVFEGKAKYHTSKGKRYYKDNLQLNDNGRAVLKL